MEKLVYIDSDFIESNTSFSELISLLKEGFSFNDTLVPDRHHHDFPNPKVSQDSTLLIMPAWNPGKDAGVKIVTVNPKNSTFNLPSIQGSYLYFDATTGELKGVLEAKSLTAKRTAATSALASSFLSRSDANSLLMIGTGALATNLIKAHAAIRPIQNVYVWGRDFKKAEFVSAQLIHEKFTVEAISDIKSVISDVDIVSSATLSQVPLIFGEYLREGQHIDLVGSYRPDMREADNEAIKKGTIFLDCYSSGLRESGDILLPLKEGVITEKAIKADLFGLCGGQKRGRVSSKSITIFKSVGHALEDLTAAKYYYNKFMDEYNI